MKPEKTEIATVVYLMRGETICLAKKKQHIHTKDGKELDKSKLTWNGYGGKAEDEDESVRDTAIRELFQESGVIANKKDLIPCTRFNFFWPGNESVIPNMDVYFFFLKIYEGDPKETDEMGPPKFFSPSDLPFNEMMPNDRVFFPKILNGEKLVADVFLGKKDEDGNPVFVWKNEELEV